MADDAAAERAVTDLGPEGAVARSLRGYEHRAEQLEMTRRVARTLEWGGVLRGVALARRGGLLGGGGALGR